MTSDPALPRRSYRPANRGLLVLAISVLLIMTILGPIMAYSELPLTGEGNPMRQALFALVTIVAIVAVRPQDWRRLVVVPIPIVLTLAWCWLSVSWSLDPSITLRRITLTTLIIWTVFIAVRQLGYQTTVGIMRVCLIVTLIANYIAVMLFPDLGVHPVNEQFDKDLVGDWRGVMQHKNFAGAVSALLIPMLVFDAKRIPVSLRIIGIVAAAIFLVYSQSKTSLGLVGIGVFAGAVYTRYSPRTRALAVPALLILAALGVAFFSVYHGSITSVLRDPDAFTGRTVIWRSMLAYINDNPLFGSGYGAFWNIGQSSPIYSYADKWVVAITTGHNGFLDLVVQIGVPGLLLALFAVVIWPLIKLFSSDDIPSAQGALVISLLIFCIAHNGTESSLFDRDMIPQVFLMFTIALIPTIVSERDARRAESPFDALRLRKHLHERA